MKTLRLALYLNGTWVGQKGESCRVFLFLAYSPTGFVLADTSLADTDNDKEEDANNKEEKDIDDEEEEVGNEDEDANDDKKGNEDAINSMLPKLKPAAATPPKMTIKKEPGMGKLATVVSKKLKISTPAFKPFLMKMLDGYMVKPYCQKYTCRGQRSCRRCAQGARVQGGVEHGYAEHDLEGCDSQLLF